MVVVGLWLRSPLMSFYTEGCAHWGHCASWTVGSMSPQEHRNDSPSALYIIKSSCRDSKLAVVCIFMFEELRPVLPGDCTAKLTLWVKGTPGNCWLHLPLKRGAKAWSQVLHYLWSAANRKWCESVSQSENRELAIKNIFSALFVCLFFLQAEHEKPLARNKCKPFIQRRIQKWDFHGLFTTATTTTF